MRRVHWLLVILPLLAVAASPRTAWCQAGSAPIVAVFNIEPVGLRLPQDTIERLSVFLNGHVAATGRFQVVPRDQLKARLVEQKKASYRQCYDQSCQIDLGKELAAQKSLASQVVKVGSRCMVSMTLFDLGRAASEAAATIQGKCDEDALADSLAAAVDRLAGAAPAGQGPGTATPDGERRATPVASAPAAPVVDESGPQVRRGRVTAATGELDVRARATGDAAARLELTDPTGRTFATGSPFKEPAARVGAWKVVAKASGHEAVERDFQVPPDEVTAIKIDLKPLGALRITGEPAGAAVAVTGPGDFRDEGGLPWEAEKLRSGEYRVVVSRPGYASETRNVTVAPGETAQTQVKLAREAAGAALAGSKWKGKFEYTGSTSGSSSYTHGKIDFVLNIDRVTGSAIEGTVTYPGSTSHPYAYKGRIAGGTIEMGFKLDHVNVSFKGSIDDRRCKGTFELRYNTGEKYWGTFEASR